MYGWLKIRNFKNYIVITYTWIAFYKFLTSLIVLGFLNDEHECIVDLIVILWLKFIKGWLCLFVHINSNGELDFLQIGAMNSILS